MRDSLHEVSLYMVAHVLPSTSMNATIPTEEMVARSVMLPPNQSVQLLKLEHLWHL
jgi:hypothetical protein